MIIKGNLDLSFSSVKFLADLEEVKGNLYLSGTEISKLPEGLKIEGDLDLSGTKISKDYIRDNFPELKNKCIW